MPVHVKHHCCWIASIFLVSLATTGMARAADVQVRAAEIVGYGLFESKASEHSKGDTTESPRADAVKGVRFLEYTNEIPGAIGASFGFQYVVNSSPRGAVLDVTNVIRFPGDGLQRPNGRSWSESREDRQIRIGERDFYGYAFDEEWEIIPGEWVFEVWHKDARLIKKTFTVLPQDEAS